MRIFKTKGFTHARKQKKVHYLQFGIILDVDGCGLFRHSKHATAFTAWLSVNFDVEFSTTLSPSLLDMIIEDTTPLAILTFAVFTGSCFSIFLVKSVSKNVNILKKNEFENLREQIMYSPLSILVLVKLKRLGDAEKAAAAASTAASWVSCF